MLCRTARYYATAQQKRIDWDIVFSPNSSRRKALNQFKKNLVRLAESGLSLSKGSQEFKVLEYLSDQGKLSTRKLCEKIMQHRINEHEVWEAILMAKCRSPSNISIPRSLANSKAGNTMRQPILKIKPQARDRLEDVIDKVEKSQWNGSLPKEHLDVFESAKHQSTKVSGSKHTAKDIDVESLGNYLQKAEQLGERRRKYSWEDQKHFSWDQTADDYFKLSPGKLVFQNSIYRRYKVNRLESLKNAVLKIVSRSESGSNVDRKQPAELLIHNLVSQKQRIIPLTNDSSPFNINYKDLFGIINSSKNAPEETLSVITQFENKGWKLAGDLYDNSETIVFQRRVDPSSQTESNTLGKKPWLWITILSISLYGLYRTRGRSPDSHQSLNKSSGQDGKKILKD